MEWIKCSERMPEKDEHVMAFIDNRYIWQSYYKQSEWYDCSSNLIEECVTYWMPLPQPPKS